MYRQKNKTPYNMVGQMKVGLIGESVTMHYLDYYCEKHKDRIAGFSDVRDDKKYQEDDIDFIVYRKDGSSFTVEAKADTYKTGNVFLETAVNSLLSEKMTSCCGLENTKKR